MKKNTETETKQRLEWIDDQFAIKNVRNYEDKNVCFFNLYVKSIIGNVAIYGCRIVSGKNGDFIAWPSQKGSDGNYHDIASILLNEGISAKIIEAVSSAI